MRYKLLRKGVEVCKIVCYDSSSSEDDNDDDKGHVFKGIDMSF